VPPSTVVTGHMWHVQVNEGSDFIYILSWLHFQHGGSPAQWSRPLSEHRVDRSCRLLDLPLCPLVVLSTALQLLTYGKSCHLAKSSVRSKESCLVGRAAPSLCIITEVAIDHKVMSLSSRGGGALSTRWTGYRTEPEGVAHLHADENDLCQGKAPSAGAGHGGREGTWPALSFTP
jgi:hypothetical protein